jgi:anti-anti-sigma regulatory factor
VNGVDGVAVTRVGTQVVVRLSGVVDDARAPRLVDALGEVAEVALHRVVVDLSEAAAVSGAGLDFLVAIAGRWHLRLVDPPPGLRHRLAARNGGDIAV